MIHHSLGLDIGSRSVKYVLLQNTNQTFAILQTGELSYESFEEGTDSLVRVLSSLRDRLVGKDKVQIDAVGMTVDPTKTLSAHRLFPFNTPNDIRQVLPLQLDDIWTIDENTQLAFEVGKFVNESGEGGTEDSPKTGYDVKVINYPKPELAQLIELSRQARLEPHIMMPANEALAYSANTIFKPQVDCWILLDIGEQITTVTVLGENQDTSVSDTTVYLSRSFKIGSACIDNCIAEAFNITPEEARAIKEQSGFVSDPGKESTDYSAYIFNHRIEVASVPAVDLARACSRGLETIAAAVRQTLLNFVTRNKIEPKFLVVTGGGAKLVGLREWFWRNFEIQCIEQLPVALNTDGMTRSYPVDALAAAVVACNNIENKYSLNLRQGTLAHKGNLAFIQEKGWVLAALVVLIIGALIFMTVTKNRTIKQEHDQLRAALEETSQNVFGKKLLTYRQVEKEINESQGFNLIPEKTAFSHFSWISSQVNDNLADVEMDFNSIDIDNQRKVVRIRGEITGDEGLPKFLQLMEQYECFPNDIPEPGTQHSKDKVVFNLSIDAQCSSGDDSE